MGVDNAHLVVYCLGVNEKDRTLAVDEFIEQNNASPVRRFGAGEEPERDTLPDEVRTTHLVKYSQKALEGRLAHYERLYAFEWNGRFAAEYRNEVERTRTEINLRKMYLRKEADRVFEL